MELAINEPIYLRTIRLCLEKWQGPFLTSDLPRLLHKYVTRYVTQIHEKQRSLPKYQTLAKPPTTP